MQRDSDTTCKHDRVVLWYAVLAIGVIAASASATIIKVAQEENVPPLIIAAARNYVACAVLLPMFLLTGSWREVPRLSRREKGLVILCGVVLAFHFTMWIMALERTSVASATIFVTTTPVFVVLGSHYILHEKVSPFIIIGILVSIVGGVLVVGADFGKLNGDILALLGAVGASAYMLIGRKVRPKLHLIPYIFIVYGVAGISLTIVALAVGNSFFGYSPRAYMMMVMLGLISSLIGHTAINFVLRHLPSYIVSLVMLGEPVSAALIAFLFIAEIPQWLEVIGCAVMLLGIYLSIRFSSPE